MLSKIITLQDCNEAVKSYDEQIFAQQADLYGVWKKPSVASIRKL